MIRYIATAAIAAALSATAAWSHRAALADAEVAALRQTQATEAATLIASNAKHLVRVWERGDELSATLATQQTHIIKLHLEHAREINRLTTGRACLSAELVGLLNSTEPAAPNRPDPLPTPPSGSDAAHASPFATDTDVGHWIAAAQRDYSTCAARLAGLIDWHGPMPAKK